MLYHSTNNPSHRVPLKEAILRSLPPDNGLYMPEKLPTLGEDFWRKWRDLSFPEIGFAVADAFFGQDVPADHLREIVEGTLSFEAPVRTLAEQDHLLELFHGPTLAFKDFGARFMARLMAWLTRDDRRELTVLVATSGDTGGAVASAFHRVPGTRVVILYPHGKVSGFQEKQLTTLGDNITALEVEGTFDDCQRMVKSAFLDRKLAESANLTSANSINLARLVPQSFYYLHAARQLPEGAKIAFVVPSGNFGNLTAGLLAHRMGLPVAKFVAATNRNDVVPRYLKTGRYAPTASLSTISNAMDVGAPSNFTRMKTMFDDSWPEMARMIDGMSWTDEETCSGIREVWKRFHYPIDPHGSVGWLSAKAWRESHPGHHTITLETAHPAKFLDTMTAAIGAEHVPVPQRLAELQHRTKSTTRMAADEGEFRDWLLRKL